MYVHDASLFPLVLMNLVLMSVLHLCGYQWPMAREQTFPTYLMSLNHSKTHGNELPILQ
jgi:hypothetical protein